MKVDRVLDSYFAEARSISFSCTPAILLSNIPTIAKKLEEKRIRYKCSNCKAYVADLSDYCKNCGVELLDVVL